MPGPPPKAMLPALNMSKVKQVDDPTVDTGGRFHRKASSRDQHTGHAFNNVINQKGNPYAITARQLPSKNVNASVQPTPRVKRRVGPGALVASSSSMVQPSPQSQTMTSVYGKPIVPPLMFSSSSEPANDGPTASARSHMNAEDHQARGGNTARVMQSHSHGARHLVPTMSFGQSQQQPQHNQYANMQTSMSFSANYASEYRSQDQKRQMNGATDTQHSQPGMNTYAAQHQSATQTQQGYDSQWQQPSQHRVSGGAGQGPSVARVSGTGANAQGNQTLANNAVRLGHGSSHGSATGTLQYQQSQQALASGRTTRMSQASSSQGEDASGTWESGSITPAQALKRYSEYLTPFEQSEILDYPHVYFVGRSGAQKIRGNPHTNKANFGYDDDRGDYNVIPHDHIAYRYEVLGILGKGSFGQVLKVHDFKTNTLRAIKVIRNKKRFHAQALVELKVLQHLRANDAQDSNFVVHIQDHFIFRNHLCISFELLSVNLYELVKQNNFMGLSIGLIRRFAQQILVALQYLRQLKIIHSDLKPENILLRQPNRSLIKVIDFGSSCFTDERVYTYIQSRFYRSPEVILGLAYGCEIDMWSLGAILSELFTGYPLFPGEDEAEQIACIMEVIGLPPQSMLNSASRKKLFFDNNGSPRLQPNSQGKMHYIGSKSLPSILPGADPEFIDLLSCCLRWDPQDRITPDQALQHPFITGEPRPAAPLISSRSSAQALMTPSNTITQQQRALPALASQQQVATVQQGSLTTPRVVQMYPQQVVQAQGYNAPAGPESHAPQNTPQQQPAGTLYVPAKSQAPFSQQQQHKPSSSGIHGVTTADNPLGNAITRQVNPSNHQQGVGSASQAALQSQASMGGLTTRFSQLHSATQPSAAAQQHGHGVEGSGGSGYSYQPQPPPQHGEHVDMSNEPPQQGLSTSGSFNVSTGRPLQPSSSRGNTAVKPLNLPAAQGYAATHSGNTAYTAREAPLTARDMLRGSNDMSTRGSSHDQGVVSDGMNAAVAAGAPGSVSSYAASKASPASFASSKQSPVSVYQSSGGASDINNNNNNVRSSNVMSPVGQHIRNALNNVSTFDLQNSLKVVSSAGGGGRPTDSARRGIVHANAGGNAGHAAGDSNHDGEDDVDDVGAAQDEASLEVSPSKPSQSGNNNNNNNNNKMFGSHMASLRRSFQGRN